MKRTWLLTFAPNAGWRVCQETNNVSSARLAARFRSSSARLAAHFGIAAERSMTTHFYGCPTRSPYSDVRIEQPKKEAS
jgi:hypothetical protein